MQAQKEESNQNSQEISIIGWSEITPKSTNWSLCAPKRSFLCGSGQVCSTIHSHLTLSSLNSHNLTLSHFSSLTHPPPYPLTPSLSLTLLLSHTSHSSPYSHTQTVPIPLSPHTRILIHSFIHSLTTHSLLASHSLTHSHWVWQVHYSPSHSPAHHFMLTPSHPYSFCTDLVTMSLTLTEHSILSGSQYYLIIATDEDSMKKKRK